MSTGCTICSQCKIFAKIHTTLPYSIDLSSSRIQMAALGHTSTPFCFVIRQFLGFFPGQVHLSEVSFDDVYPVLPWSSWFALVTSQFPVCCLTSCSGVVHSQDVSQPSEPSLHQQDQRAFYKQIPYHFAMDGCVGRLSPWSCQSAVCLGCWVVEVFLRWIMATSTTSTTRFWPSSHYAGLHRCDRTYRTRTLFCRTWTSYDENKLCVSYCYLQPKFTKVSTECVIDSRKRKP